MPRRSRWDDVVAAAAKVFRQSGFAGASMEQISDELGMWKGSLYHYVSTKEELLVAVIRTPAHDLLTAARELQQSDLPASEKIRRVAHGHVDVLTKTYDFAAVYLHEIAGRRLDAEWHEMDREYVQIVQGIIADGIREGAFAPTVNPHTATMALIGALNWITRWWKPAGDLTAAELADQINDCLLAGLLIRRQRGTGEGVGLPTQKPPQRREAAGRTRSPSSSKP